jgi:16S rRNA (guanine527-N7)-methyltransferase
VTSPVPNEIVEAARGLGVEVEGEEGARLAAYLDALLETNKAFNLTSITDRDEAWRKHVLDSLTLVPLLRSLQAGAQVVDVGSGGGLPGLPLAIALPSLRFTLLEATSKKARFLGETAKKLRLDNVQVENGRAESFGRGAGRERFDVATSRALSRCSVLFELTLPLLKSGGASIAIKGEQAEQELQEAARALELLHGQVETVQRTPTGTIVVVRKMAPTAAAYPRRPGEPKRSPL